MSVRDDEKRRQGKARGIGLGVVTLSVAGAAHPILGPTGSYSSYEILIFLLNGAVLSLLLVRTGVGAYFWMRRPFRDAPAPPLTWVAPVLLVCFVAIHVGYDTLFFQKFPLLMVGLIRGFRPF